MRTITITQATKIKIPERQKYERLSSYNRYVEAINYFNKDCDKYLGKTIEIRRINQAIAVYGYAGANGPKAMPSSYLSQVSLSGKLTFGTGYSNPDYLKIIS